jgi:hypothetical protein
MVKAKKTTMVSHGKDIVQKQGDRATRLRRWAACNRGAICIKCLHHTLVSGGGKPEDWRLERPRVPRRHEIDNGLHR